MAAAAQSITKPADRGVNPAMPDYPVPALSILTD
jgi:hypothetical protein